MNLGYRIIRPADIGTQPLNFVQISLWRQTDWGVSEGEQAVSEAIEMSAACRARGIRSVFHPLDYPLTNAESGRSMAVMKRLAAAADLGIIIHDEGCSRGRLSESEADTYEKNVRELGGLCPVSIENSYNSGDITWFWERFVLTAPEAVTITLDIGHLELAGIDSIFFVRSMPQRLLERVAFVHMHHHEPEDKHMVKDHKPLIAGCREIDALKALDDRKKGLRVILELDAAEDGMRQSIEMLKKCGIGKE